MAVARGMTSSHNFFVSQIEKNSTTTLNRSQCACLMRKCVISVGLDGFVSRSRRCFLSRARYRRRRLFDHDPWKYDTFLPRRDLAGRWPDLISSFCSFPPPPRMRCGDSCPLLQVCSVLYPFSPLNTWTTMQHYYTDALFAEEKRAQ